ncbi:MAG: XrtA/PEP-CTERM system exopolysaccharide export protein [Pseudomonadales bacterium]
MHNQFNDLSRQAQGMLYVSKRHIGHWALLITASLFTLGGCTTPSGGPPPEGSDLEPGFADEYRIGVGDNLRINVWRNDDLSADVPVRPDGKISVPLAGDVLVGGKTPEEVASELTKSLATYIRDPYVTVIVTDMGSDQFRSRVRVTGAVNNPLSIPYRQGMTVLDVVLEAGGVNEFSSPNRSVLYRRNGDRISINLDRILKRGDMATNFPLRPGDVITVPERAF